MTQVQMVEQYIKDFGSITTFEAFKELGVTRLSDKIYRLKKKGCKINSENVTSKNRYGHNVTFSKYYFDEESK